MPDFRSTLAALGEGKIGVARLCSRLEELLDEQPQLAEPMLEQLEHAYIERLLSIGLYSSVKRHIVQCQTHIADKMQAEQPRQQRQGAAVIAMNVADREAKTAQDVRDALAMAQAAENETPTNIPSLLEFLPASEIGDAPVPPSREPNESKTDDPSNDPLYAQSRPPELQEDEADTLDVGSVIRNRFKLLKIIGQSGMGKVFKCIDLLKQEARDQNPYLAVKLLNEDLKQHPEAFIAMEREFSRQQRLTHPNIVTVYDFDRVSARSYQVYILMELLEGLPLDVYIRRTVAPNGGLPLEQALPIIRDLGQALEYIHQKNIVHADLKPSNCFLLHDKRVKLLDFGIARVLTDPQSSDHTHTLFDAGKLGALTPAYASLEMLEQKSPDPCDDIYALGCVTYELLTGEHPFSKIPADVARDKGLTPAPVKDLSPQQMQALRHALAFERKHRSTNITTWLAELEGTPPRATKMWQSQYQAWAKEEEHTAPRKRSWKLWATAAAAALFLAGLWPVLEYARQRQINQVITVLERGDQQAIIQTLETLDRYRADERQRILDIAGYTLQRYFQIAVEEITMPEQGSYDFPRAEQILKRAEQFYPDTPWLEALHFGVKERKAMLLQELSRRYEAHLAAGNLLPDNQAEDITDVLEMLAVAAPEHPLLKSPRLVAAYRQAADKAYSLDKPQQALNYVLPALALAPDDRELRELKDKTQTLVRATGAEREKAKLELASDERAHLGVLIAQPRAGDDEWENEVRSHLLRLDGLLPPDDPTPERARDHVAEIYLPAVQHAAEETRFADARRILDRVERITGKTPLLETARTDIKQALESVLHQHDSERSGEPSGSLEPVKVTLLTQLIDRDIAAARLTLHRLREELPNDDPFLVRAYRSFEDTYLRLAEETARREGNGAALTLLQEGAGLIPGASRLQKAQQKYMSPGNAAGRRFRDCDTCPEMATLPMGSFRMGDLGGGGSEDERPVREVAIQYLLAVGIYEVTVAEYSAFQAAPAAPFPQSEDSPVVNVRWDEAVAYAEWLSAETGEPYRLLTEAEWEYAARAGTATKYAFGNTWNAEQANAYGDADGHQYAMAVGSFPANDFGLHDMHGNVWEWVSDCWNGGYRGAPTDGSSWDTGDCLRRVVRGGSWDSDRQYLRSSNRNRKNMTDRYSYVGFRVAKTLTPEPEAAP